LSWTDAGSPGSARLELPPGLRWSLHRGETEPILGWYAPGFGRRVPAWTLLGRGRCVPGTPLTSRLEFADASNSLRTSVSRQVVSWWASDVGPGRDLRATHSETPDTHVEAR